MNYKNTKFSIILPLVIALSIVIGFGIATLTDMGKVPSSKNKMDQIFDIINENYVDEINRDSIEDIAITDFLHNLDPHTYYMNAKETSEMESDLTGNFVGIGIRFYVLRDSVVAMNIIHKGAAEKAGLLQGDRIVEANGKKMSGVGIKNDSVRSYLLGNEGEIVKLKICRKGKMLDINVVRSPVEVESVFYSKLENNIGYIKIVSFSNITAEQFAVAVDNLKKENISSLIIDLRDNSGGYMHAAKSILDYFFENKELLVYTEGKHSPRETLYSTGFNGDLKNYPLAVLVNESTASASEILAGVIQDYDLGTIIGNVTFGKGLVQRIFDIDDGSTLRLTVSRYYLPSGRCVQKSYNNGYLSYMENFYANYGKNKLNTDTTKVFYTKKGRKVYEGDGLMPDILIEHDTSYISNLLTDIGKTNILSDFAADYYDKNIEKMNSLNIETPESLKKFLENDKILEKFLVEVRKKNISISDEDLKISKNYLTRIICYSVAVNYLDLNKAYTILFDDDEYIKTAKSVMKK